MKRMTPAEVAKLRLPPGTSLEQYIDADIWYISGHPKTRSLCLLTAVAVDVANGKRSPCDLDAAWEAYDGAGEDDFSEPVDRALPVAPFSPTRSGPAQTHSDLVSELHAKGWLAEELTVREFWLRCVVDAHMSVKDADHAVVHFFWKFTDAFDHDTGKVREKKP